MAEHDLSDVREAIKRLSCEPRAEYQPAFPDLGNLIERTKQLRKERMAPPKFIPCGKCYGGMIYLNAKGEPCEFSQSPARTMGVCECKKRWMAAKADAEVARGRGA